MLFVSYFHIFQRLLAKSFQRALLPPSRCYLGNVVLFLRVAQQLNASSLEEKALVPPGRLVRPRQAGYVDLAGLDHGAS
jgi:hypothetical protein